MKFAVTTNERKRKKRVTARITIFVVQIRGKERFDIYEVNFTVIYEIIIWFL